MSNNMELMKTGFARIHSIEGGAVSVYVDKEIGKTITLPAKTRLKASWNEETEQLIIERWPE